MLVTLVLSSRRGVWTSLPKRCPRGCRSFADRESPHHKTIDYLAESIYLSAEDRRHRVLSSLFQFLIYNFE
jgi:hypothetical protein